MTGGMANDHEEFSPATARRLIPPARTQSAVAVGEPGAAGLRIARGRETQRPSGVGRVDVAIRRGCEGHIRSHCSIELGGKRPLRLTDLPALRGVVGVRVSPLHDVVVLGTVDGEPVEVTLPHQRFHVRGVSRRIGRRQFDDHAAGREFEVESVLGIEGPPVGRSCSGQDGGGGGRGRSRRRRGLLGVASRRREAGEQECCAADRARKAGPVSQVHLHARLPGSAPFLHTDDSRQQGAQPFGGWGGSRFVERAPRREHLQARLARLPLARLVQRYLAQFEGRPGV